jgi:hypothetical protein
MDGPAHLYNANLIHHLIFGNTPQLEQYFSFNKELLPNCTGHSLLALLNFIMPLRLAQKVLLFIIVFGMNV